MNPLIEQYISKGWKYTKATKDKPYDVVTTPDNTWDITLDTLKVLEGEIENLSPKVRKTLEDGTDFLNLMSENP